MKGIAHPSPFAALAFPGLKKSYPFTAGLTEFSSPHMAKPGFDLTTFWSKGLRPTASWAQQMKGIAHPSAFAALSFPGLKKSYPFTAGLTEFSSPRVAKPGFDLMTFW